MVGLCADDYSWDAEIMGLLKAGMGALGGVLADQWRDYFYCESLDADTLVVKGEKRTGGRSDMHPKTFGGVYHTCSPFLLKYIKYY